MKKTIKFLTACCLALLLLTCAGGGVSAAAANSVWVNGIELNNNAYLSNNSATTASSGTATEPAAYVAWFHDGTLSLNNAEISNGASVQVYDKTGNCVIYAVGDLTVALKGNNIIGTRSHLPLCGVYVKDGDLEFSAANQGALGIIAGYVGIFASDHDVTFSGNANVGASSEGTESNLAAGIFVINGDVAVKDHATVSGYVDGVAVSQTIAALYLVNGSVSVTGHSHLNANGNLLYGHTSYGILATRSNGGDGGNVTVSDRGSVEIPNGTIGISAAHSVALNEYTNVTISVKDYGLDTAALTIHKGYLNVHAYDGSGTPLKGTPSLTLDQSYLAAARINNGDYLYDPEDLEAIGYDSSHGIYIYDGNQSNRVDTFIFYPEYAGDQYTDCMDWN